LTNRIRDELRDLEQLTQSLTAAAGRYDGTSQLEALVCASPWSGSAATISVAMSIARVRA
jgi:hypothetical protein